uniref:Uncharacterized protein n=1 Tax=Arundo donax TaxID=35708 RepID=A0A0A9GLU6_ARUDO
MTLEALDKVWDKAAYRKEILEGLWKVIRRLFWRDLLISSDFT